MGHEMSHGCRAAEKKEFMTRYFVLGNGDILVDLDHKGRVRMIVFMMFYLFHEYV